MKLPNRIPRFPQSNFIIYIFIFILALSFGCDNEPIEPVTSGAIKGKVYDKNSNKPLSGVHVEAEGQSSTSDDDGSYKIVDLPNGVITVKATSRNYKGYEHVVTVAENQPTKLDIYMEPSTITSIVSGIVQDEITNEPLSGVTIRIGNQIDITDQKGFYQFLNMPIGMHRLSATRNNYMPFETLVSLSSAPKTINIEMREFCYRPCAGGLLTVTYLGKTYNTVQIGEQCWLRENLDVGEMVVNDSNDYNQTDNGIIEKFCYDNDTANCRVYGGLYTWDEAMQYSSDEGVQGICPDGWHIPTLKEWQTLSEYVGYSSSALKSSDFGGRNTSCFSSLLSGYSYHTGGFFELNNYTDFWSSTKYNDATAYTLFLSSDRPKIDFRKSYEFNGYSVRCVKD